MSLEDNKQIVRRFIEEAINKGNVDASGDYIAEDVVELVPFPGQGPGLSGLKDVLKGLRVAFPDMHWNGCLGGPISGVRTGLEMPKKTTTPCPPQRVERPPAPLNLAVYGPTLHAPI